MRVLQVHKFFYPHAGSETVLFHTRDLLKSRGHEVRDFAMSDARNLETRDGWSFAPPRDYNDRSRPKKDRAVDALATIYSRSARRALSTLLDSMDGRPDVAHLHLISHQLTFSVVDELRSRGIPTVMTLHDYKIGCPAYVLYRDGARCTKCIDGPVENVIRYRCLKGSAAGSAIAAVEARIARSRGSWLDIDAFVTPSAFAGEVAVSTGVDRQRVHVIQNFLPETEAATPLPSFAAPARFFIASRLEAVKGIRELLQVFTESAGELGVLAIAGAGGELEPEVIQTAHESPYVEYLGRLSRAEVLAQLRVSRASLTPSLWDENNPMSLLEARAAGTPVIATRVGGLPEMVTHGVDGFLVDPGNLQELRDSMLRLAGDPELASRFAAAGRERLEMLNSPAAHYPALMNAYEAAIRSASARAD